MKEVGDIIEINKKLATIRINRKSACENCNQCGLKKKDNHIDIIVDVAFDAEVGDQAVLELSNSNLIKSAVIVYAIPLVLALVGLFLSNLLELSELWQGISIFLGIVIGGIIIYFEDKRLKKQNFAPHIVEVIKNNKSEIELNQQSK